MLKYCICIGLLLPLSLSAFRTNIKNVNDIPHGRQLEGLYINGFARKFPQCITYLSREQKHDQNYRRVISYLEALITNGIKYHKHLCLSLPQSQEEVDNELIVMIKNTNLDETLPQLERNLKDKSQYRYQDQEVTSVFIDNGEN